MTSRRPCPPAPGPLEDYAQRFDPLLASLAQRHGLRDYLQGLLLPRDRNKTLTALADAEPIVGAQHRQVQRLQWFLSESTWDHEAVNQQRIDLLQADPASAPPKALNLKRTPSLDRSSRLEAAAWYWSSKVWSHTWARPLLCEASAAISPTHATPRYPAQRPSGATMSGVAL
jgi:DDE superfamily endonuclease